MARCDPEAWLADVLSGYVNGWPNRRFAELTPRARKAAQHTVDRAAAGTALLRPTPNPGHHASEKQVSLELRLRPNL